MSNEESDLYRKIEHLESRVRTLEADTLMLPDREIREIAVNRLRFLLFGIKEKSNEN